MTLVRFDPVRHLASLEIERLNRMFNDAYGQAFAHGWTPLVDVFETDAHEFVVKAELPEMKREEITVTFENGVLTISGERKASHESTNDRLHRVERQYGSFARAFTLPATTDAARISAAYKDGVLTVRVPQREDAKPKQIDVQE